MPYRRTENVARRLAEREQTILGAAHSIVGEKGMGAVQIAAVAQRADIAAGTIYRYFPSKNDLVGEVIAAAALRELVAMHAAGVAAFAARALHDRRLAWAIMAEPIDPDIDALRLNFRRAIAAELEMRISTAIADGHLPEQDVRVAALAMIGALLEGLLGPLAPQAENAREAVQAMTLFALRALGVIDARARGLVAQCEMP